MIVNNSISQIVSLNVGMPVTASHGSKQIQTGIFKSSSTDSHQLKFNGLSGDGQADLIHHGGPDKAVCVYCEQHYPYWEQQLERKLEPGAFGENWTISEWTERDICIGDIIQAGEVVVQVSQPRQPCYKIGIRHQMPELTEQVQKTGYTGFYFRVLQEGRITAGIPLLFISRHPAAISIAEANRIMYTDKNDVDAIKALLAVDELAASWRNTLSSRLLKLQQQEGQGGI
ncbi:MAG: MOSC domain-containing protein [Candidatus Pristimantibacillus sp.]